MQQKVYVALFAKGEFVKAENVSNRDEQQVRPLLLFLGSLFSVKKGSKIYEHSHSSGCHGM
jgi:hypothetical protein